MKHLLTDRASLNESTPRAGTVQAHLSKANWHRSTRTVGATLRRCRYLGVLTALCLASWSVSASTWAKEVIHTRHANIIHEPADRAFAEHLAQVVDEDYATLIRALDMNIGPRVQVVVTDELGDRYNANATLAYHPVVRINPIPHQRYEFLQPGDTQRMVLRHELAHILTSRKVPDPLIYRLGYVPGNNLFVPLAFHEGYAQWFETDFNVGQGRAQGINPLSEGLWRQEYQQGFQHYTEVFEVNLHEQAVLAYLYGAYFFTYLVERFGADLVRDWTESRSADFGWLTNIITPFTLHVAWQTQFEESLDDTWRDFLATERARLERALTVPGQSESHTLREGISRYRFPGAFWQDDTSSVAVWRDDQAGLRSTRLIIEQRDGGRQVLRGYQPVRIAGDQHTLWFNQIDSCGDQPSYSLYRVAVASGQVDRVLPCSRIANFDWHSERAQLVAWQLRPGGSRLVLLDESGQNLDTLLEAPFDLSIKAVHWYPGSTDLLLNLKPEARANFDLYRLEPVSRNWQQLTDDSAVYHGTQALPGGGLLYSRAVSGPDDNALLQPFRRDPTSQTSLMATETRLSVTSHNVLQPRLHTESSLQYLTESGFAYAQRQASIRPMPETRELNLPTSSLPAVLSSAETEQTTALEPVHEPSNNGTTHRPVHPYLPIEHMAPTMVAPYPFWRGRLRTGEPGVGVLADWRDPTQMHQATVNVQTLLVSTELQGTLSYTLDQQWQAGVGQALHQDHRYTGYRAGWQRDFVLSNRQALELGTEWISDQRHQRLDQPAVHRRWVGTGIGYRFGERSYGRYRPNVSWLLDIDHEWALTSSNSQRLRLTLDVTQGIAGQQAARVQAQGLWTDQADAPFVAGGSVGEFSVFARPIPSALTRRGLPEPLIGDPVVSDQLAYQRWSLQWLLAEPNRTAGPVGFGVNTLWLEPFANAVWDLSNEPLVNLGAEISAHLSLQWLLPLSVSLGYAVEPIDSGDRGWYLTIGPR